MVRRRFAVGIGIVGLLFYCCVSSAAALDPPGEAVGFSGDGLHLYPLGWSSEGRWGALIGRTDEAGDPGMRILVIDAVTDDILFSSESVPWDGPDAFDAYWARHGGEAASVAASFDLEAGRRPDVRNANFTTGGFSYTFTLDPPSPASGRFTLEISSSRGDAKDVYQSPVEASPDRAVLLGALVSPFEARALAVIREYPAYGTGVLRYRFSGAHLTLGFTYGGSTSAEDDVRGVLSAVFNGQLYLVKARLGAGADPNEVDERGYSAVLVAARLGHWEILRELLAAGANPSVRDASGRTPLHHAAFAGNAAAVRALLAVGADPEARDRAGATPRQLAADEDLRDLFR